MLSAPLITGFGELMLEERVAVSRSQDPSQEEEETVRRKSSCVTADGAISEDSWHPQQRTNGREVWESFKDCKLEQPLSSGSVNKLQKNGPCSSGISESFSYRCHFL